MQITVYTFTTSLLMVFALFVLYTRSKNWLESNVPIIFYIIMIAWVKSYADHVPALPVYVGLALALLLRFEFMGKSLIRFVKFAEFCAVAVVLWECFRSMTA
ncbi:MAG TPA: hypothetical protein VMJ34_20605 [Bryobacteraceae bacterium]|nr:hypothetical protein [Bryobacteraceae bacterium]